MTNGEIVNLLRNVAASYNLKDSNKYRFQSVAYERAADAVEHSTSELKDLWDDGKLEDVPGIGPSIAKHLDELFKTGKSTHFEELMKDIPSKAFELMKLPKIGIKTAIKLLKESPKEEIDKLLSQVKSLEKKNSRHLLPIASVIASEVTDYMLNEKSVKKIDVLGSLRRKVATVGDIDILVAASDSSPIMDHFIKYPKAQSIIEKGEHTASLLLPNNVQVDLLVVKPAEYGSALQHFTGSKHHNVALREYALKKGYSLSEYGIKKVKTDKIETFDTEEKFYNFLGLKYIPPEIREDTGEIEASKENKLPKLIDLLDVKGDLQIHSDFDIETSHDVGSSSMQDIVKKALEKNYEYIAFTEHNPSKHLHTQEQITDLLKRKNETVEKLNYSLVKSMKNRVFKVFNSLEIDMNKDGTLPVSDAGLETLDFALVSIHTNFELPRVEMTKRVLNALSHPKIKIFAHPTGRKINEREGVELNWPEIFEFCLKHNKWIEINADPMRLDLPDILVREAVKLGVKLTLGTDSHNALMLDNMQSGIAVARRGWCETKNVVNCLSLKEFEMEVKRI